jgi:hypothetical protein
MPSKYTNLSCPLCDSSDAGAIYQNIDEKSGEPFFMFRCMSGNHADHPNNIRIEDADNYEEEIMNPKGIQKQPSEPRMESIGLLNTGKYEDLDNSDDPWGYRGLTAETLEYYGVSVAEDVALTRNRKVIEQRMADNLSTRGKGLVFPYYSSVDNTLICQKVRTAVDRKGAWYKADSTSVSMAGFFGQNLFNANVLNEIAVTFGEMDAMAVHQMVGVPTVSVSNGDQAAQGQFRNEYSWLSKFDRIILIPDNDESCRSIVPLLGAVFPRKIRVVELTKYKDPCEYLINKERQLFAEEFYAAQPYSPEKIINLYSLKKLIFEDPPEPLADYPWEGVNKKTGGIWAGDLVVLKAFPKVGKCFGKDTPVLMWDGSVKKVQDVKEGDLLMGDDSTPREVKSLARGRENLYKVKQNKRMDYVVNESHIMSVMKTGSYETKDVPLLEYLEMPQRERWKGYAAPVFKQDIEDTERPNLSWDAQVLGLWLGDGTSLEPSFTTTDDEIVDYLQEYAQSRGMEFGYRNGPDDIIYRFKSGEAGNNYFLNLLKRLELLGDKHIPDEVYFWPDSARLSLLAGLLDSDGHLIKNIDGDITCVEIVQKNKYLAKGIVKLAQFCGFRASMYQTEKSCTYKGEKRTGTYYRIFINGDLHKINGVLPHKQTYGFRNKRNPLITGIEVEAIGIGDYYGFVLDGNHRFLLSDCTVVHNTTVSSEIVYHLNKTTDYPIGLIFLEETQRDLIVRFATMELNKNLQVSGIFRDTDPSEIEKAIDVTLSSEKITLLDHFGSCSSDFLEEKIKEFVLAKGCQFIFFDHISMAITDDTNKDERLALDRLVASIKALTVGITDSITIPDEENGGTKQEQITRQPTVFMVTHVNDDGKPRGSRAPIQMCNTMISLERDKNASDDNSRNTLKLFVEENRRFGDTGLASVLSYSPSTGRLNEVPLENEGERHD